MIPTTIAGLLVMVLALLPGVPGDRLYRLMAGVSWREKLFDFVLRLLLFSTLGLALYSWIAARIGWPPPSYVVPATFAGDSFTADIIPSLGIAWVGHVTSSTVVGALVAWGRRFVAGRLAVSAHRDAWDHFVEFCMPGHWVVITLRSGDSYLGMIDHADIEAQPDHRDVILSEPSEYDPATGKYTSSLKQTMFLRATDIASIASIYDAEIDKRLAEPETVLLGGSDE